MGVEGVRWDDHHDYDTGLRRHVMGVEGVRWDDHHDYDTGLRRHVMGWKVSGGTTITTMTLAYGGM